MSSIWQKPISLEILTQTAANTAVDRLGIEFTEIGDDYLRARVPVGSHLTSIASCGSSARRWGSTPCRTWPPAAPELKSSEQ